MADWQAAEIVAVAEATPRIRLFTLRPERWAPFDAGQHLDVRLTAPDGYQAERSYSVCSAPETEGTWELAVELMPDGEVSPWFHEVAAPGDRLEARGPFGGHFAWRAADGGPLLLMGGGSGLAPLVSIVRHHAAVAPAIPVMLVCAARTWDDIPFRDEILAREAAEPALTVILALSRDTPRRPQDIGMRLDAPAVDWLLSRMPAPAITYVCGNNGFVETVTGAAVDRGLAPGTIRTERFGG